MGIDRDDYESNLARVAALNDRIRGLSAEMRALENSPAPRQPPKGARGCHFNPSCVDCRKTQWQKCMFSEPQNHHRTAAQVSREIDSACALLAKAKADLHASWLDRELG